MAKTVLFLFSNKFSPTKEQNLVILHSNCDGDSDHESQFATRAKRGRRHFLRGLSMKNQKRKKIYRANVFLLFLAAAITITAVVESAAAKSLYVIADIKAIPTPLQAYDIAADGTLTFQAEYDIPHRMLGAVGLAIDSDSGHLFVTYEASDEIRSVDATTMRDLGSVIAPDAIDLAGIVYDHAKGLVYCVDRGTTRLYAYEWDPIATTLTPVPGSPFKLKGARAYGIALDEIDGLLYVANGSTTINVYNTSNWSLADTISVSRVAISIAVDVMNGLVYSGGGFVGNHYLTQYHLATGTEAEVQVEPDAGVIGVTVDAATGLVYISTGVNNMPGGDDLLVYDMSLNPIWVVTDIGNPTGLIIPGKDIGYNPLNLSKTVIGGIVGTTALGKIKSVGVDHDITYSIYFDNYDNDYTVTDVSIFDTLPDEVSFVTADDDGVCGHYDHSTHSYQWSYPSLPLGSSTCLELTVRVNQGISAGTTITNSVTINSNETPPTTTSVDVVTAYNALNLNKSILGGVDGRVEYVDASEIITYSICFDNNDNDFYATDVSVVDILPDEVNFVTADSDGVSGHYDPATHTYMWSYPSLPPGLATCVDIVVQVNPDIPPGTIITNSVVMDSNETPPTTDSVDVITYYNPLNLSTNIIGGVTGEVEWVDVNETITYGICFDNNDNDYTVTNVSIVDILPDQVSFVTADGDGVFGQYDPNTHTYTWLYPSLPPGSSTCLELVVQVNQDAAPGVTITNSSIIDSDETPSTTASVDVISSHSPLNLSKNIIGGVDGQVDYVDVEETITYGICFDNHDHDFAATDVSIVDTLPDEVSFVTADGDGVSGHYDPATHTYTWFYPSLPPGSRTCLELIVQVNQGTPPVTAITNFVTIDSEETQPTTASVDVVTCEGALEVDDLRIIPSIMRRESHLKNILAIIRLPQGVGRSDIEDTPLVLDPGKIKARRQFVFGSNKQAWIFAWFDKAELMDAVPGCGRVKLKVVGKLKSNQSFYGTTFMYLTSLTGGQSTSRDEDSND